MPVVMMRKLYDRTEDSINKIENELGRLFQIKPNYIAYCFDNNIDLMCPVTRNFGDGRKFRPDLEKKRNVYILDQEPVSVRFALTDLLPDCCSEHSGYSLGLSGQMTFQLGNYRRTQFQYLSEKKWPDEVTDIDLVQAILDPLKMNIRAQFETWSLTNKLSYDELVEYFKNNDLSQTENYYQVFYNKGLELKEISIETISPITEKITKYM